MTIRPCDHACRTAEPLFLTRKFIDRTEFRSRDLLARTCSQLLLRRDISLRSEAGLAGAAGAVLNFEQLSIRTRKQVADRLSKAPGWMAFGTSTASPRPPLPPASFALALSSCSSGCIGRTERGTATGLFRHKRGVKITCERCGRQKRHRVEAGLAMAMNRGRESLRIKGRRASHHMHGLRAAASCDPADRTIRTASTWISLSDLNSRRSARASGQPSRSKRRLDHSGDENQGNQNEGEQKSGRCIPEFVRAPGPGVIEELINDARHHLFTQ